MSNLDNVQGCKAWAKPEIRAVVPVDRTRGGAFNKEDQDDIFYKVS